jgi:putative ABC transport system ATP-binding protein
VLELIGATKVYPGGGTVRALHEVSLVVRRGELVAVVGPSGSGKSTLLNLVGALDRPSGGRVRIDGNDTAALSDRELSGLRAEAIGFVFQSFNLVDGQTALDNVANALLYRGIRGRERRRRAALALAEVGLADRLGHRPAELSGGERQRVAIARAVVGRPAILLADEPTGNLDSVTGAGILALFRQLHAAGHTIVIVTHDPSVARAAPRHVTLSDGRIEHDRDTGAAAFGTGGRHEWAPAGGAPRPAAQPQERAT